jgi:CIC family chloride channel protein
MRPPKLHLEIPHRLRAIVRSREISVVVLAAAIGVLAGLVVTVMSRAVDLLHRTFFDLPPGTRLSAGFSIDPMHAIGIPLAGGLLFGLVMALLARWRAGREVDPIEANALHGGRMSLYSSLLVAGQTVWSSGVGASVGLEAGYTQLASGLASRIGQSFRLRRGDLRILVGCGTAGAIAAAFGAPLAGAFYAFELVIGSYSVASLAPVGLAALLGYAVARAVAPTSLGIFADSATVVTGHDLVIAGILGLLAAGFGIALMRGVSFCEALFVRGRIPRAARPALGGLAVGLLALVSPQVMSSGHGALHLAGVLDRSLAAIALVFVLKALASIVSLGSGFRGGLFFASLLLGALGGQLFASGLGGLVPSLGLDPTVYAIVGMGALSVSVVGGPLTMTFIALETTGNFGLTTAVLVAVIIAMQVTRETFGYSFATWRFHLRGETIRSAADIGWIRDLTVGRMMRPDVRTVPVDTALPAFRETFPLGSTSVVVATAEDGTYAGLVMVAEAHAPEFSAVEKVGDMLHHADDLLWPHMTVREAIETFDRTEAEALAVGDAPHSRRVVGLLSEAHALRRYTDALELRRRDMLGQD